MSTEVITTIETVQQVDDITRLRMKKTLAGLDAKSGTGTSMITICVPSGGSLLRVSKKIAEEKSVAANIKSRV